MFQYRDQDPCPKDFNADALLHVSVETEPFYTDAVYRWEEYIDTDE